MPAPSFTVQIERYGALTIDNLKTGSDQSAPGNNVFGPPPLSDPALDAQPTSTAASGLSSPSVGPAYAVPPIKPAGPVGIKQLFGRSWTNWFEALYKFVKSSGQTSPGVSVTFEAPSIDETDIDWYGIGSLPFNDADLTQNSDSVTFTPTIHGSSKYGRVFAVGDFILWNNPTIKAVSPTDATLGNQYVYEIDKITAITLDPITGLMISWTVQRRQLGAIAGYGAWFGTLQAAQSGVFWRLIDKFWTVRVPGGIEQPIRFLWDSMCVPAVVATVGTQRVQVSTLPDPTDATKLPPSPGLRTLNGAEYVLGTAGAIARGSVADYRVQVAGPESLRSIQGRLATAFAGTGAKQGKCAVVWMNAEADPTSVGLIDVITFDGGAHYSYAAGQQPQQRRQMPYFSAGRSPAAVFKQQYPPNALPSIHAAFNPDGSLSPDLVVDPTGYLIFEEGGWIDYVWTAMAGSGASDFVLMVQT